MCGQTPFIEAMERSTGKEIIGRTDILDESGVFANCKDKISEMTDEEIDEALEGRPELTPPECDDETPSMRDLKGNLSKAYEELQENHPEIGEGLRKADD